jgi:hypothetical protein
VAFIGDENADLRSRPTRECAMSKKVPFSPMPGQPNPELEHMNGPQKAMLAIIAVGFLLLIGLLAYLPVVGSALK